MSIGNIEYLMRSHFGEKVYFDSPVVVKKTPHVEIFNCHGVWVHGVNGVWLLDGAAQWHGPLNERQANAPLVISSIYQRLQIMANGKKIQAAER